MTEKQKRERKELLDEVIRLWKKHDYLGNVALLYEKSHGLDVIESMLESAIDPTAETITDWLYENGVRA